MGKNKEQQAWHMRKSLDRKDQTQENKKSRLGNSLYKVNSGLNLR
jgi:hypothetical protein